MRAVVFGPGRIGCGFVGQLLREAGADVTFVARDSDVADHISRHDGYRVRLVEPGRSRMVDVTGVSALALSQQGLVMDALSDADFIATAVGPHNLTATAPVIGAAFRRRTRPVNVVAFENLLGAGAILRSAVAAQLPAAGVPTAAGFSGAVVARAVARREGTVGGAEPFTFVGDFPSTSVVDGTHLQPGLPSMTGMIVAEDYDTHYLRKLYTFSAGHAAAAYLGHLKGYTYLHAAVRDPEIREVVLAAMSEGERGLAARFGSPEPGSEWKLQRNMARFDNAALSDPVERVGRDPQRKLGATDRLVGAARLARTAGVVPVGLAAACSAALLYWSAQDPSAVELRNKIQAWGIRPVIRSVAGLNPRRGLGRSVAQAWSRLAAGWATGNHLLSFTEGVWAWAS